MNNVVVITGPTATGKSTLAVSLAEQLGGEIVNADSMQVYRAMNIGTAKPSAEVRDRIPHHLFDICDVTERFSAGAYLTRAEQVIRDILDRGNVPIVVGGTGLYTKALVTGFFEEQEMDTTVEACLSCTLERVSLEYLYRMLQKVDPKFAARLSPRDTQRIFRGLTFYFSTGKKLSSMWKHTQSSMDDLNFLVVGLSADREKLYRDINARVDLMMADGLLDEVRQLYHTAGSGQYHAFKAIGYRELIQFIEGNLSLEEAVERIKQNTRRFAKRQLTWFKGQQIEWFHIDSESGKIPVAEIRNFIIIKMKTHGEEN